jgi:hypothetical protein
MAARASNSANGFNNTNITKYIHIEIPGDGNCFYHCVELYAKLFGVLRLSSLKVKGLRNALYTYIKNNIKDHKKAHSENRNVDPKWVPLIYAEMNVGGKNPYDIIKQNRHWEDAINEAALNLAPDAFEIPICTFEQDPKNPGRMEAKFGELRHGVPTIIIYRVNQNHYELLIPYSRLNRASISLVEQFANYRNATSIVNESNLRTLEDDYAELKENGVELFEMNGLSAKDAKKQLKERLAEIKAEIDDVADLVKIDNDEENTMIASIQHSLTHTSPNKTKKRSKTPSPPKNKSPNTKKRSPSPKKNSPNTKKKSPSSKKNSPKKNSYTRKGAFQVKSKYSDLLDMTVPQLEKFIYDKFKIKLPKLKKQELLNFISDQYNSM